MCVLHHVGVVRRGWWWSLPHWKGQCQQEGRWVGHLEWSAWLAGRAQQCIHDSSCAYNGDQVFPYNWQCRDCTICIYTTVYTEIFVGEIFRGYFHGVKFLWLKPPMKIWPQGKFDSLLDGKIAAEFRKSYACVDTTFTMTFLHKAVHFHNGWWW